MTCKWLSPFWLVILLWFIQIYSKWWRSTLRLFANLGQKKKKKTPSEWLNCFLFCNTSAASLLKHYSVSVSPLLVESEKTPDCFQWGNNGLCMQQLSGKSSPVRIYFCSRSYWGGSAVKHWSFQVCCFYVKTQDGFFPWWRHGRIRVHAVIMCVGISVTPER